MDKGLQLKYFFFIYTKVLFQSSKAPCLAGIPPFSLPAPPCFLWCSDHLPLSQHLVSKLHVKSHLQFALLLWQEEQMARWMTGEVAGVCAAPPCRSLESWNPRIRIGSHLRGFFAAMELQNGLLVPSSYINQSFFNPRSALPSAGLSHQPLAENLSMWGLLERMCWSELRDRRYWGFRSRCVHQKGKCLTGVMWNGAGGEKSLQVARERSFRFQLNRNQSKEPPTSFPHFAFSISTWEK